MAAQHSMWHMRLKISWGDVPVLMHCVAQATIPPSSSVQGSTSEPWHIETSS
eukprot:CAMPEP_0174736684 /NCGR_PEP_ID=MMETSP1094-20130205/67126_1 /TAXON_ID=156173 /ORGANISM="Chrysochromulina brevifilum, Strain UTEX LB 985" /LENGTH=51 /DNA_ID=CAMNT_0015939829 /DNA_START=116 /DNA_END=272 /DNA_ORIENTATION=+